VAVQYIGFTESSYGQDSFSHTLTPGAKRRALLVVMHAAVSGAAAPSSVTFGGQAMTKAAEANTTGIEPDTNVSLWWLDIPEGWSGAKTVSMSGGTHSAHHMAWLIEIHAAAPALAQSVAQASGDITLTDCAPGSFLLSMASRGGWGVAYYIPSVDGDWVADWVNDSRAHLAVEIRRFNAGNQAIWIG